MAQKPLKNLLKSKKVEKNAAKSDLSLLSTDPFAKKMIPEIVFETQKNRLASTIEYQTISTSFNQNKLSRSRYNSNISSKKRA